MVTHLDNTLLNAHLSYTQFEQAIKQFESQTRRHQPWSLVEYQVRKGVPAQFYLSRTDIVVDYPSSNASTEAINGSHSDHVPEINGDGDILVENEDSALEEIEDDAEAYQNHAFGEVLSASYHIVYSPTYQVPVLYFNAYRSNGVTISIDEIFTRLVPEAWRTAVRNAGLSGGVSQQV
ncbi:hypothetical protein DFQ27_001588 [Actinomortierella ambigua]|uniref:Ubiquitin-like-conjugating enzyme ATG10 n=1 Tax=Actinomortierella ambigua TaxID=1343610 RepID=A0A9P6U8B9_9FUNG|nr:hypothetical protein DFQ27_001588 [Actinomortierella ambigua]